MTLFNYNWFLTHQRILLWLLNFPLTRRWFRHVLRLKLPSGERIDAIGPHFFIYGSKDLGWVIYRTRIVHTHPKYAKRLFYGFRWLWALAHAWDATMAQLVPALDLGFAQYRPDPDPENTSVDGNAARAGVNQTWADIKAGAGTFASDSGAEGYLAGALASSTNNQWQALRRSFFLFDTTGSAAVVTAQLKVWGTSKSDGVNASPVLNVYASAPASNTALVAADYNTLGTTPLATGIAYDDFVTGAYNIFTLNAAGVASIDTGGITKFGLREATYDAGSNTPPWVNTEEFQFSGRFADATGLSQDPVLVINEASFIPQVNID